MKKLNKKGFSLVELIIVIAIMLVLVGVLAPTYLGQVKKSKIGTDIQNAGVVATSIAVKTATADDASSLSTSYVEVTSSVTDDAIPSVKLKSDYVFVYKYANNQVYVGVQQKASGALTGSPVEIYPEDKTSGSSWAH